MRARIISIFVLAASLLVASQVWAQSDGAATFGGQWWTQSNPEAKYQEYRDLPRGGFLEDYVLREFNGPWAGAIWGENALRTDQNNSLYLANGIKWRLDAKYDELPHLISQVTRTPYAQVAPGVFVLPDSLQKLIEGKSARVSNADLLSLLKASPYVPIGVQTDVSSARLRMRPMKDWEFEVSGASRQRSGSQEFGTPFGFTTLELPAPIDQRTVDVDATGTYTHASSRVMLSVGMSDFTNQGQTLRFDNFKVLTNTLAGSAQGQMAMAPDNKVMRGRVAFSQQLPMASTFTATVGYSQTTQDQAFVPMTVNPVLAAANPTLVAMERNSLDGKVDELVQDYRLTGRPVAKLYTTLRFREEKMDDKTADLDEPNGFINYDQAVSAAAVTAEPWSHTNDVLGLDADYSLMSRADLSLLAEYRTRKHPDREIVKDAESVIGGKLHVRLMDELSLAGGYKYGQRKMDSFDLDAYDGAEWPLFRRYDVADRNQSVSDGQLTWSPMEKFDVDVNGWWTKDDYPNSVYGLNKSEEKQVYGEGNYHWNANLTVSGGYGYGVTQGTQSSIEIAVAGIDPTSPNAPWQAVLRDRSVYYFGKAAWWAKPKKLQVTGQYTFTRDLQDYAFTNTLLNYAVGATGLPTALPLPNEFYRTNEFEAQATWHYSPILEFSCRYDFTQYDVNDPLAQTIPLLNVNPANYGTAGESAASAIFLGANALSYRAHSIQVMASRRF